MNRPRHFYIEIFLVSFAALLLEISYTRIMSFKLFYYYTYLIIGLALLGIGSGGVFVAIVPGLRRIPLRHFLALSCLSGSFAVGAGYFVVALTPLKTLGYWLHGPAEFLKLLLICFALFATFLTIGVVIAALFSRRADAISRLYFADLLGAALACAFVVPLMDFVGTPACILAGACVLAVAAIRLAYGEYRWIAVGASVAAIAAALGVAFPQFLPEPVTAEVKTIKPDTPRLFSKWNSVFRVDLTPNPWTAEDDVRIIHHDGTWGSTLHRFDGDVSSLTRFDSDERSYAFRVPQAPPRNVLIIGAAGGHEVLASLYFRAEHVTAVELNPVTISLLTDHFADYTGNLARHPRVTLIHDEGRSFLARQAEKYDLIFFVAPDSYAAMNAASAGAFVLSESYLYTVEMIVTSLDHLTPNGIICMQFGEIAYEQKPNRTARYAATAREALGRLGVADPSQHILVATVSSFVPPSSIVLLKREPFSEMEIDNFLRLSNTIPSAVARHAPRGRELDDGPVNKVISLPSAALDAWYPTYPYNIEPISDDSPFFWHFARFRSVLAGFDAPLAGSDFEDSIGERLLLLMIAISVLFAAAFLLLPFVAIRRTWWQLPAKSRSFGYFGAIGLGFMFFEICLIQKLTLLLGYPTHSLTVTLMSLLVFTGIGSVITPLYARRRDRAVVVLFLVVLGITLFYEFWLGRLITTVLAAPLAVRIVAAVAFVAPLGMSLGAFMPLGLATVAALTEHKEPYVAWGWAVNGFFSVIGSVLTTVLSMALGFKLVLFLGLLSYAVAALLLRSIPFTNRMLEP